MLDVYTLEQSSKWDQIVRSFSKYDIYWLSGYARAFKIHGDGEPLLFYYETEIVRGINIVMKRDISHDTHFIGRLEENKYFDFATPYGYGGWLIEGAQTDDLFCEYEHWCQDNGIISEFIRFHPMVRNHERCLKHYDIVQLGEVVHMDLTSPEVIWGNITSKNRNVIRKAKKNGVTIYNGRFPEIFEKFRQVYNGTMDKDNAEEYYYFGTDFYRSIMEDLPRNAQIFYAVKEGTVIAASIILAANGMLNYHLSGSLREYSSLAATNLLLYEVALWGYENGYKSLYLGGGVGSGEDSLFKFKRAFFRGDLNHFYIGKKTFSPTQYDKLLQLRRTNDTEIINSRYFPQYRG